MPKGTEETCSSEYMPDWLKKCLTCKHAYKTKDNDLSGNAVAEMVNVTTKNINN